MKKKACLIISLLLCTSWITATVASYGELPTIDSLLVQPLQDEKVEVCDELDAYSFLGEAFDEYNYDFRFIILQREDPKKEFTAKTAYPPFDESETFDPGFDGVDIGRTRVQLRTDLMRQLPQEYRANSMRDATYLLVAETDYDWDGTLISCNYEETSDDELPEFNDLEEMYSYFAAHPKTIKSMTYYPKFGVYSIVTIYETATKRCAVWDCQYTPSKRFARNPEAGLQWERMSELADLMDALTEGKEGNLQETQTRLEAIDFVPQEKIDLWNTCLKTNEISTAYYSVSNYLWEMAEQLKDLDPSETNRANYDLIIQEKNLATLGVFVNYCNYSGFDRSLLSIEQTGDYMAKPEYEWMDQILQEIVDIFKQ